MARDDLRDDVITYLQDLKALGFDSATNGKRIDAAIKDVKFCKLINEETAQQFLYGDDCK